MTEQLRMTDIVPGMIPPPEVWDCMETCAHAYEYVGHFPGSTRPRCEYGIMQVGVSGEDMYQKTINNTVHVYCRFYEEARA
jgi:hypothetical protein